MVHAALFLLFLSCRVDAMAAFNVSSMAAYLYCMDYLKKGRMPVRVFYVTYAEIMLHSFMAAICVGWDLGFAQYMIGLVPFGFYTCMTMGATKRQKYLTPSVIGILTYIAYLSCRLISVRMGTPFYDTGLSGMAAFGIYAFNTTCLYVLLFWSSFVFLLTMGRTMDGLEEMNACLKDMASIDPLTGLYNRRHMMGLFGEAGEDYCVIMCDIDNFKKVNDGYGHDFGDLVLKETAALIRETVTDKGHICRWGGEEIVILSSVGFDETCGLAEQIRAGMEGHAFSMHGKTLHCTLTMGVAGHGPGDAPDVTIKAADERLYFGKQNGKNRVVCG